MIVVAALLGILAVLVLILIKVKRDLKTEHKMQQAAEVLFRYRGLESALNNDYSWNANVSRIFICAAWKDSGKRRVVFDPEKEIRIGYSPKGNHITVLDPAVSAKHCILFQRGMRIFVSDVQSTNGTIIKRGFRKLRVRGTAEILDRDTLCLGHTAIKIYIRTYQPRY